MSADRVSVRLSGALLERLDALAAARRVSRSELLRRLVSEAAMVTGEAIPSEQELLALVAERARSGSVAAIRLLLDREARRDPADAAFEQEFGGASMLSEPGERRLVLLARHLGPAPSDSQLRRVAKIVEADDELSEFLWTADLSGSAWRGPTDAVDAAGLAGCGLGLLDLVMAFTGGTGRAGDD